MKRIIVVFGMVLIGLAVAASPRPESKATDRAALQRVPTTLPLQQGNTSGFPSFDEATRKLSFQALLTSDTGDPLEGPVYLLKFEFLDGVCPPAVGCTTIDTVELPNVPLQDGVVSTFIPIDSPETLFNGGPRALRVSLRLHETDDLEPLGEFPLASVPHALRALRVNRVASAELDDDIDLGDAANKGLLKFFDGENAPASAVLEGVPGGLGVQGSLDLGGEARLHASLSVDGPTTLGNTSTNRLSAAGDLAVGGTATVLGDTNLGNQPADKVQVAGKLTVGSSGLEIAGPVDALGNFHVGGAMTLDGAATLHGDVTVVGQTTLTTVHSGDVRLNGNLSVGNAFDPGLVEISTPTLDTDPATIVMRHRTEDVLVLSADAHSPFYSGPTDPNNMGPKLTFRGLRQLSGDPPGGTMVDVLEIGCINEQTGYADPDGYVFIKGGKVHPDMAEAFEVAEPKAPPPGTVMVIDAGRRGALRPSADAYDTKVAGIVSGAGDSRPVFFVGYETGGSPTAQVALAGRVNCLVDTSYGAIKAGDLIVTSPTPGHGMAASDPTRTAGAVLGKAMESMEAGRRGLLLVLVSLQ